MSENAIIPNLHPSDLCIRLQLQELVGNVKFQIFCNKSADKFEQLSPAFQKLRNSYETMINSVKETAIKSNNLSNLAKVGFYYLIQKIADVLIRGRI